MKNFATVSLFIFIFFNISLLAQDPDKCLIAYWSFDDSTAHDFSGNGYHGRIINHPQPVAGVKGTAFRFQGKGYYITANGDPSQIGDHILLPMIDFKKLQKFTITMWVKEEGLSNEAGEGYLWYGEHGSGWLGLMNYGQVYPRVVNFSVGSNLSDKSPLEIELLDSDRNRWVFYTLIYDNGVIKGYKDAVFAGSKRQDVMIDENNNFAIARHWWWYEGEHRSSARFTGTIDEVKIFSCALTDEEIKKEKEKETVTRLSSEIIICEGETIRLNDATYGYRIDFESCTWKVEKLDNSDIILQNQLNVKLKEFENNNNPSIDESTFPMSGTYIVTGVSKTGTAYKKTIIVRVIPKPRPEIKASSIVSCSPVILEVKDTSKWKNSIIIHWSTGESKSKISVSQTGLYKVYLMSPEGCIDSAEISIIIKNTPNPEIVANGSLSFCEGDSIILSADKDYSSYKWSDGQTTKSITAKSSGTYVLTVTNRDSCQASTSILVQVYKKPTINITSDKPLKICEGDSIILTARTDAGNSVVWQDGSTSWNLLVRKPGQYKAVVYNSYGCKDSMSVEVEVLPAITASIKANGQTMICHGDTLILSAEPKGNEFRYEWSTGEKSPEILISKEGSYSVSVSSDGKCTGMATVNVSSFPQTVLLINGKNKLCKGDSTILSATPYCNSYKWSTGETSSQIVVKEEGDYELTAIDTNGCRTSTSFHLDVVPLPEPVINIISFDNCNTDSAQLSTKEKYSSLKWYNADNDEFIDSDSSATIRKSGNYYVVVTNENGCEGKSSTIKLLLDTDTNKIEIITGINKDEFLLDTAYYPEVHCKNIRIKNKSVKPYLIQEAWLIENIAFSIPQSQFPIEIPAGGEKDLMVCFSPATLGTNRDTLIISDTCSPHIVPLSGQCEPNTYISTTGCNVPVKMKTISLPGDRNYLRAKIYPNPAKDIANVEINSNSNANVNISIYNSIGGLVQSYKLEAGNQGQAVSRLLKADVSCYPDGIYEILISSNNNIISIPLNVIK